MSAALTITHHSTTHTPSHPTLSRYSEPKPRPDGFFVTGKREFKFKFNVWRLMGDSGEVRGEPGMPNGSFQKPISEHIKNIFRGRQAWGCKHQLVHEWAQMPAGQLELPAGKRFTRGAPSAKRSRAGLPKPVAMAPLEAE